MAEQVTASSIQTCCGSSFTRAGLSLDYWDFAAPFDISTLDALTIHWMPTIEMSVSWFHGKPPVKSSCSVAS